MTTLQKNALGRVPMTLEQVEAYYRKAKPAGAIQAVMVCESHERLRMELEGSAVLHDDSAKALRQAADDMEKMREGLLRIFARCENWSADDTRANVADMLGMTVKEVQAEIDSTTEQPK